jgi:hypothetical protein
MNQTPPNSQLIWERPVSAGVRNILNALQEVIEKHKMECVHTDLQTIMDFELLSLQFSVPGIIVTIKSTFNKWAVKKNRDNLKDARCLSYYTPMFGINGGSINQGIVKCRYRVLDKIPDRFPEVYYYFTNSFCHSDFSSSELYSMYELALLNCHISTIHKHAQTALANGVINVTYAYRVMQSSMTKQANVDVYNNKKLDVIDECVLVYTPQEIPVVPTDTGDTWETAKLLQEINKI